MIGTSTQKAEFFLPSKQAIQDQDPDVLGFDTAIFDAHEAIRRRWPVNKRDAREEASSDGFRDPLALKKRRAIIPAAWPPMFMTIVGVSDGLQHWMSGFQILTIAFVIDMTGRDVG
ncbi:hypothetical protein A8A54_21310 [Brucella pseudogrignonensis]|uniref:hypothetical protein n=1 Tax=Brucella pseudogrignonensis TaxID=419475 RepID=UPI0007DA6ADF|nr:hypothetical protein [Brucella pseudogrignonensis]ANG99103.1 hypothetical protein A8A54_21310 [Brucella pseudogrignonensis]